MPPCAVRGKSWPPFLHKVFGYDRDVAQEFGRGLQVPVGGVDVDVTHVSSQGQHMLPDSLTASGRRLQCPDRKRVAKVMNAWPSTAGGLEPRRFQQGPERAVNFPVHEWLPFVRNENMVATASRFLPVHQVVAQSGHSGIVKGHQSRFLKLSSADQQTVGGDIGDQ